MNQLSLHLETVSRALEALASRNAAECPLLTLAACHLRLLNLIGTTGGSPASALRPERLERAGAMPQEMRESGHVLQ